MKVSRMQKELTLSRGKEERALSGRFPSGGVCSLLLQAASAACRTTARPAQTREVRGDAKRNPQLSVLGGGGSAFFTPSRRCGLLPPGCFVCVVRTILPAALDL